MNGLIKVYNGKRTCTRGWYECLHNCVSVYETIKNMCDVTEEEKLRTSPVMLSGDATT